MTVYKKSEVPAIVEDLYRIIDNDEYMWCVVWGNARVGKSSLCLKLAYWVYKDWDKVLDCIVFSLDELIYKLKNGIPELRPTRNGLHMRIPLLIWDDFAVFSGKARTQHQKGWDEFKGAFDSLGVKIGVLIANMVDPTSPTQQLQNKFTHEIFVPKRGVAKFDVVERQQDFRNWNVRPNKVWLDEFEFTQVPEEIFRKYDKLRCDLAEEILFSITETIAEDSTDRILRRINALDLNVLQFIKEKGLVYHKQLNESFGSDSQDAITRLKSRKLVMLNRDPESNYAKYDLTDLGLDVLKAYDKGIGESIVEDTETP